MSEYRRNHVLSECLLERFQDANGNIIRHDIDRDKDKLTRPGLEGFRVKLWTKTAAQTMEQLWSKEAETDIQAVFAKIDARKYISRNELTVLARFCAIHFVRSNEFIKLYEYIREQKTSIATSDNRLDFANKYVLRSRILKDTRIPSKIFENIISDYYFKSSEHLQKYGVEIGMATGAKRLILPDGGLLISRVREGKYQPSGGVALLQATEAVLPISPKLILAFNVKIKRIKYKELDDRQVANCNTKLLNACDQYFYRAL